MWSHSRASLSSFTVTSFPWISPFQFLSTSSYCQLYYSCYHPHGHFMCALPEHFRKSNFCEQYSFFTVILLFIVTFCLRLPPSVILQKHFIEFSYLLLILRLWFTKCNWKKIISTTYRHFSLPFPVSHGMKIHFSLHPQRKESSLSLKLYGIRHSVRNMDMSMNKRIKINCCVLRNVSQYRAVDRKKKELKNTFWDEDPKANHLLTPLKITF